MLREAPMIIREYVDDYVKYYPERWRWMLAYNNEQNDLYLRTRARPSNGYDGRNYDLKPDFYSIERDAAQFGLREVRWTDIFGIVWEGKKGIHDMAGAPNYEGNLYYYNPEESYQDDGYCISYEYNDNSNQPPEDTYTRIPHRGYSRWIDTANVVDAKYYYVVENHLFKDTRVELIYEDGEIITVWGDYQDLINGLLKHGNGVLVQKILKSMNEHFIKLRDSDREEERKFYPRKTAEEMFLKDK